MPICEMCGDRPMEQNSSLCQSCEKESQETYTELESFLKKGHTQHCACRLVWGDGECECGLE